MFGRNHLRPAFSLVEVLVVLSVLGIAVGLLLPAVQQARATAARVACQSNMRQVTIAVLHYHDTHHGFPPANSPPGISKSLGWMAMILPEAGEEPLYRAASAACVANKDPLSAPHLSYRTSVVKIYSCPADGRITAPLTDRTGLSASYTSFVGIAGAIPVGGKSSLGGIFDGRPPVRLVDVRDGASQTVMIGERPPPDSLQAGWWYPGYFGYGLGGLFRGPNNELTLRGGLLVAGDPCSLSGRSIGPGVTTNPCDRYHLWSLHRGGANCAFADGSVHFLNYSADAILPALATRAGGEVVTLPD